jgi:hypothetical protein
MGRRLAPLLVGTVALVALTGLAGCGGATETDSNGNAVVTRPATEAQNAVDQQNQQLDQLQQRVQQDDPTMP